MPNPTYYTTLLKRLGDNVPPEVEKFCMGQIAMEENPRKALEYFEEAALLGFALARTFYAYVVLWVLRDDSLYHKACEIMDGAENQNYVNDFCMALRLDGGIGVTPDLRRAYQLYTNLRPYNGEYHWPLQDLIDSLVIRLADGGAVDFMGQALRFFSSGEITPTQYFQYLRHLVESADGQGYAYSLAVCYSDGVGVMPDPSMARHYFDIYDKWQLSQIR